MPSVDLKTGGCNLLRAEARRVDADAQTLMHMHCGVEFVSLPKKIYFFQLLTNEGSNEQSSL